MNHGKENGFFKALAHIVMLYYLTFPGRSRDQTLEISEGKFLILITVTHICSINDVENMNMYVAELDNFIIFTPRLMWSIE